jgi:hypothetical protein
VPGGDNQTYMVDDYFNSQTEYADKIEVEVDASNCDRVAIFNMDAYSVDLELTDEDTETVVMSVNIDLSTSDSYKSWIVEPIYIYANATLKISINKSGGTAKCGLLRWGVSTYIGKTPSDAKAGFSDYSIKDTDQWGRTYLNAGNWAKELDLPVEIYTANIDDVYEDLVAARGISVIIEGNENDGDFETFRIFCYIEAWRIRLRNSVSSDLSITIRGMV